MPDDPVTLGELVRRFDRLEEQIDRRFDALRMVPIDVYERDRKAMQDDIEEIREKFRWFWRQVIGAAIPLVLAAVVAVIAAGR